MKHYYSLYHTILRNTTIPYHTTLPYHTTIPYHTTPHYHTLPYHTTIPHHTTIPYHTTLPCHTTLPYPTIPHYHATPHYHTLPYHTTMPYNTIPYNTMHFLQFSLYGETTSVALLCFRELLLSRTFASKLAIQCLQYNPVGNLIGEFLLSLGRIESLTKITKLLKFTKVCLISFQPWVVQMAVSECWTQRHYSKKEKRKEWQYLNIAMIPLLISCFPTTPSILLLL